MSYARPSYDAADATWVGASEYTRQPYNEANASFQETNTPTTSFALEVFVISFPISPDTQSLTLVSYEPRLVIDPVDCVNFGLEPFCPSVEEIPVAHTVLAVFTPTLDSVYLPLSIEFRQSPLVPWVMPMTSPVYPPSTTFLLEHPLPDVSIHGFWSPHAMLFGWGYDENTDIISIPISTLFELTTGQADATTGDWRAVVLALVNSMWDSYVELDSPPQAMVLDYSPGYMMQTGPFAGYVKSEYVTTAYLNFPEKTLADEP